MKRILPFVIVAALIIALVYVNRGINRTDGVASAEERSAASAKPPAPPASTTNADTLQPELTIGNPAIAKSKITVGWIYDDTTQPDPAPQIAALQAVEDYAKKSGEQTSAVIVDLDVPPSDRSPAAAAVKSLGIQLDGNQIGPPANPGTSGLNASIIQELLPTMAMHFKH